jgi:hypothetical protein
VTAPPLPTPHKALAAAIRSAMTAPLDGRLTEAHFSRYADLSAGWNFRLVFLREVTDTGTGEPDVLARRIDFIIDCWERSGTVFEEIAAQGARLKEIEDR